MKSKLAQQINHTADIARTIKLNYELDLVEGELYDNRGKAESWTDRDKGTRSFIPETEGTIDYVFYCDNVPCHLVDYNNEEDVQVLGAEGCESEGEVLVAATTKMRIISGPQEVDFEEMGYYTVYLELVEEDEE